jgi:acetolactate synthase I/II/III large subunit
LATEQALVSALKTAHNTNRMTIIAARIDGSGYVAQFNALREL